MKISYWKVIFHDFMVSLASSFRKPKSSFKPTVRNTSSKFAKVSRIGQQYTVTTLSCRALVTMECCILKLTMSKKFLCYLVHVVNLHSFSK